MLTIKKDARLDSEPPSLLYVLLHFRAYFPRTCKMSTAEKRSAEEVPEAVKKAKTAEEDEEENIEEEEDDLDEEGEEGEEGEDEEDGEDEGVGLQSMNIAT